MLTNEPLTGRRVETCSKRVRGQLRLLLNPGRLQACVTPEEGPPIELNLPGEALDRALLYDGKLAWVTYDETSMDGELVDRSVAIVNSGTPMNGQEWAESLRSLFETEEDKQEFLDRFDRFWPHER